MGEGTRYNLPLLREQGIAGNLDAGTDGISALSVCLQLVLKAVHQFVAELRAGGPYAKGAQQPVAGPPAAAPAGGSSAASSGAQPPAAAVPAPKAAVPAAAPKPKVSLRIGLNPMP